MAETIYRGPAYSIGGLMGNVITQAGVQVGALEPTDGPGVEYQANCFPDVRFAPFNKDSMKIGRLAAFLNSPYVVMVDCIPSSAGAAAIAAAQAVTAATPMTLTTVDAGGSSGVPSLVHALPILTMTGATSQNFPPGAATTSVIALDFGFTTGNTNGTSTVTVPDSTLFYIGQWIIIGGGGNAAKTLPLICQVLTLASTTTITVTPTPASTLNNSAIGSANFYGPFPPGALANAAQPYVSGGVAAIMNPLETISRCVSVTGNAGSSANNVTVKGFDIYGMAMSEVIAFGGGAATKFGQKAFKYVVSATPATTDAGHTLSIGYGDTIGFTLRADRWEYANIFFNGSFATTSSGWLKNDATTPATTSTGDVRATVQLGANGNGSTPAAPLNVSPDGTKRLTIMMSVPLWNLINATPINPVPMFGVTQV